jgi:hypothetical protein
VEALGLPAVQLVAPLVLVLVLQKAVPTVLVLAMVLAMALPVVLPTARRVWAIIFLCCMFLRILRRNYRQPALIAHRLGSLHSARWLWLAAATPPLRSPQQLSLVRR